MFDCFIKFNNCTEHIELFFTKSKLKTIVYFFIRDVLICQLLLKSLLSECQSLYYEVYAFAFGFFMSQISNLVSYQFFQCNVNITL